MTPKSQGPLAIGFLCNRAEILASPVLRARNCRFLGRHRAVNTCIKSNVAGIVVAAVVVQL